MHGDTQAFIIRIWQEMVDDAGQTLAWRGSIEHVGSGLRLYFQDLESTIRFIEQHAGISGSGSGTRRQSWLAKMRHDTT